ATPIAEYQAEEGTHIEDGRITAERTGYTGESYVDYGNEGSYVEWSNIKPESGTCFLSLRYANGTPNPRTGEVKINDEVWIVIFEPTGEWTDWSTVLIPNVILTKDINMIRVKAISSTGGPNLDKIEIY
ncbi:MAG: hypothetical protein HQL32_16585, partial [Planctomycetes bacterium]|nr:hypothetical protein [Planctomycetota bacterium]